MFKIHREIGPPVFEVACIGFQMIPERRNLLKGGDRRVRILSAHNNWWATPEVSLPLPYKRSAKVFLNLLRQGVKTMYYFKNMYSKSLKCAK